MLRRPVAGVLLAGLAWLPSSAAGAGAPAPGEDTPGRGTERAAPDETGLDDEATILAEAESDPRNFFPDAFPVIRHPRYVARGEAEGGMDPDEWVIGVVVAGQALAYPINVLNQHEIVIDERDGVPFMVCWCPLCRTGMVYDRRLDADVIDFGHSGKLYRNAFLLYETGTGSLWHHATGQALSGEKRGRYLEPIPCHFVKWSVWTSSFPSTLVLAKDPEDPLHHQDQYARMNREFELTYGLGVLVGGVHRLYGFLELEKAGLVEEEVGGVPIVVYRDAATETTVAWERTLDGKVLDFEPGDGSRPTLRAADGSAFDAVGGECLEGPLRGRRLRPVLSSYWEVYAWEINHPGATAWHAPASSP